jgi:predicted RecA/RadA family phage recombinase
MATNYNKAGRVIDWLNGTGASVAANVPVAYGIDQMGIALGTIADAAVGSVALEGEFQLPKHNHESTGAVAVAGQPAYWLTDKVYDAPGLGRQYLGIFAEAAASAVTTCLVKLRSFRDEGPRLIAATITANVTVSAADLASGELSLLLSNAAARTVNLPSVAAIPRGAILKVRKTGGGAHALTINPAGDETIAGSATHTAIDADNDYAMFQSTGAAWLLVDSAIA